MKNKIYCGDCLEQLKKIPKESVDLIYLDPPFHSGKDYDVIWNNGYEQAHFDDTWYSDGQRSGMYCYIEWLEERVRECNRVLKLTGSLYLHCDHHASAYIRLMLDRVFNESNFRNEIVWCYRGGGVPKNAFARKHDIIFFYSKGDKNKFNTQFMPYSKASEKLVIGRGGVSIDGKERDLKRGAHMVDWWEDINSLQTWSPERIYPTQKPLALLERIIKASSSSGDIILDPMCGGGTTIVSAQMLDRKWIGMDVSPTACRVMIERLSSISKINKKYKKFEVTIKEKDIINYPLTSEQLKELSPLEFENWVRGRIKAKKPQPDKGIDAISQEGINFFPRVIKRVGIQIKQQYNVGNSIVRLLKNDIRDLKTEYRISDKYGIIVAFSFTRGAKNKCAEYRQKYGIDIKLITTKELIDYKSKKEVEKWY